MEKFQITGIVEGTIHTAKYLGEYREWTLNNETSERKEPFRLNTGDEVIIDTDAHEHRNMQLFIGTVYQCEGSWWNHKNYTPTKMTFHAVKTIAI